MKEPVLGGARHNGLEWVCVEVYLDCSLWDSIGLYVFFTQLVVCAHIHVCQLSVGVHTPYIACRNCTLSLCK